MSVAVVDTAGVYSDYLNERLHVRTALDDCATALRVFMSLGTDYVG